MSLNRNLANISINAKKELQFDIRTDVMERFNPEIQASEGDSGAVISIYGSIGEDLWSIDGGWTAKRLSAELKAIGNKPVEININSGGGNFFEGIAMYNVLREFASKVTIKVIGLAASAASIIAMAGDEILMGDGSFIMIHNAWAVAIGNQNDLRATADMLAPFDAAMAAIYSSRTGMEKSQIETLMDAETWLDPQKAIDDGFATGILDGNQVQVIESKPAKALAQIELALAKQGMTRSQRREVIKSLSKDKPSAVDDVKPSANDSDLVLLQAQALSLKLKMQG